MEEKTSLYWLPRVILCLYPVLLIGNGVFRSLIQSFNLMGFAITVALAAFFAAFIFIALSWRRLGGLMILLFGLMILFGVVTAGAGFDFYGLMLGGSLSLAGGLLVRESFHEKPRPKKEDFIIKEIK